MRPRFNSFPSPLSNQIQSNDAAPPFQSQVFPANPPLPNFNMFQNYVPLQQPQLGIMNTQIPIPFNNPNFPMPNMAPLITQQLALLNQMGMAQMGFAPQNHSNSMNTVPMLMNQLISGQTQGQPFSVNFSNILQQLNQNMGFPNMQNLIHNLNPSLPIQLPNPSQPVGPHSPNFFPNPPFLDGRQQANANQLNFVEDKKTQQLRGNSSSIKPQTQNSQHTASFKKQGNPVNNGHNSTPSFNSRNFRRKDFRKNLTKETSNLEKQKSQFHHMNNGKRKFGISSEDKGTGHGYERATKSGQTDFTEQARETKRSRAPTYTEQEINQWREERRKNYPTKANIEKKHSERTTDSGVINEEAKLRREQLKEILAKQAELGVEVAEIPSHYILDSKKPVNEREDNGSTSFKKGRSWKKHDRRVRTNKRDRFAKKRASSNKDSSNKSSFNQSKPTLLQKLLSADVRRDKRQLLQVLRFMVENSFFEDWPEKPLNFPLVVVKEGEMGTEKSLICEDDFSEVKNKKTAEKFGHVDEVNGADNDTQLESETCYVKEIDRTEEEEGEIIN